MSNKLDHNNLAFCVNGYVHVKAGIVEETLTFKLTENGRKLVTQYE